MWNLFLAWNLTWNTLTRQWIFLACLVVRFSTLLSLYSLYVNKMALPEVCKQRWRAHRKIHFNSRFPNNLVPPFQNESSCRTFDMKTSLICTWRGNTFSYESFHTRTRFETEAKGDSLISGLLQTVLVSGVSSDRGWTFNLQRLCKFFFFFLSSLLWRLSHIARTLSPALVVEKLMKKQS